MKLEVKVQTPKSRQVKGRPHGLKQPERDTTGRVVEGQAGGEGYEAARERIGTGKEVANGAGERGKKIHKSINS